MSGPDTPESVRLLADWAAANDDARIAGALRRYAALLASSPAVGEAARVLLADLRAPYGEDCGLWLEVIPAMEREYQRSGGHMGAALRAALARLSPEEPTP